MPNTQPLWQEQNKCLNIRTGQLVLGDNRQRIVATYNVLITFAVNSVERNMN